MTLRRFVFSAVHWLLGQQKHIYAFLDDIYLSFKGIYIYIRTTYARILVWWAFSYLAIEDCPKTKVLELPSQFLLHDFLSAWIIHFIYFPIFFLHPCLCTERSDGIGSTCPHLNLRSVDVYSNLLPLFHPPFCISRKRGKSSAVSKIFLHTVNT